MSKPNIFDRTCLSLNGNIEMRDYPLERKSMTLMNETLNSTAPNLASDLIFFDKKREFLQEKIKILNKLCHEIDPYKAISQDHQMILSEFGIANFDDPFEVTNRLVLALEDSIEEFQSLEEKLSTKTTSSKVQ